MRYLFLIPVLALFLSNIPFRVEMPAPAAEEQETCSLMQEEMNCDLDLAAPGTTGCCTSNGTTCSYFCCFQVWAPVQQVTKYSFQVGVEKIFYGMYREVRWNNPYIDDPLQPPDVV